MPVDPASTRPSRSFQKAVLAEWKMLREGLPETIWVRAFEGRLVFLFIVLYVDACMSHRDMPKGKLLPFFIGL